MRQDGALAPSAKESAGRRAVRQAAVEAAGSGAGAAVGTRAVLSTKAIGTTPSPAGSLAKEAAEWGLRSDLIAAVEALGHDRWFPVQRDVVPALVAATAAGDVSCLGDVAITAPTGSGKTLAYLLPMLHALAEQGGRGLRGLVLLPTRELAAQVHGIAAALGGALGLRVELVTGHTSLAVEAAAVSGPVDVVVATPGRLVDHLDRTPGFSLAALQWMVVDEADRLLAQSYNHWIRRVYEAVWTEHRPAVGSAIPGTLVSSGMLGAGAGSNSSLVAHNFALAALALPGTPSPASLPPAALAHPLRRVLVSATLTNNPQHMAALALHRPTHFTTVRDVAAGSDAGEAAALHEGTAGGKFITPTNLTERFVTVKARDKSLAALHLILAALAAAPPRSVVLVFTGSLAATHRLTRLLQLHGTGADIPPSQATPARATCTVAEFSSSLRQDARSAMLAQAASGQVRVLVSSDAAARGLDLPNVAATVSYDPPGSIRTYVHRVGRAARAGREGAAYTILLSKQRKFFLDMMHTLRADMVLPDGSAKVSQLQLERSAFTPLVPRYKRCLAQVPSILAAERAGDLQEVEPVAALTASEGERIPLDDAFEPQGEQSPQSSSSDSSSDSDSSDSD